MKVTASLIVRFSLFLIVYCAQPLVLDMLKFQGAASPSTFLYLLPHYLAMVPVGFFPTEKKFSECNWWKAAVVSFLDVLHQLAEKAGLVYAGSAVYIVIGSSSIVWTAVLSVLILKRSYTTAQWCGILLICVGLCSRALTLNFSIEDEEFFGVLLVLPSAILHALSFVVYEKYLHGADAIPGTKLTGLMGIMCAAVLLVWTGVWTVPRFDTLVIANIKDKGGSISVIVLGFILLYFVCFIRASVLWWIIKSLGAVSAGILKGIRTATVFIMGHVLFCHLQPSQCLTPPKALAASICVLGVIVYSVSTISEKQREDEHKPSSKDAIKERLIESAEAGRTLPAPSDNNSTPSAKKWKATPLGGSFANL